MADFSEFVRAIPAAAASPGALVAYVIAALCNVVVLLKTKRNKQLIDSLSALPEHQRLKALELEMGAVRVPAKLTPEQWLRSRIHYYVFVGFLAICAVVIIVSVLALTRKLPEGEVTTDFGLYDPPHSNSIHEQQAGIPAPLGKSNQ